MLFRSGRPPPNRTAIAGPHDACLQDHPSHRGRKQLRRQLAGAGSTNGDYRSITHIATRAGSHSIDARPRIGRCRGPEIAMRPLLLSHLSSLGLSSWPAASEVGTSSRKQVALIHVLQYLGVAPAASIVGAAPNRTEPLSIWPHRQTLRLLQRLAQVNGAASSCWPPRATSSPLRTGATGLSWCSRRSGRGSRSSLLRVMLCTAS